ncbi:aminoglycoside 2''-phosphotransferase [Enterococcus sp. AZ135]|uniref:phosphotransferase family protein n=1 Tax=unclassified Enterococcus TaxID=2608891 RepID=UPI003F2825E8
MEKSEAIRQIRQVYPDLIIEEMVFLGAGFDSEAFLLNRSYVFKFPRHARAAKNLYKEAIVLKEIRNKLPLKVPEICFVGKSTKPDQLIFVGHEKIEGVPLDAEILATFTGERKDEMAKEIASFFKVLHNIELTPQIEGLEVDKKNKASYEYEVIKESAFPLLKKSVQQEIDEVYNRLLKQNFHYKKCLIHNDFGASNVYYDQETDQICGMIDFGDIAIYDRDMEFVCLMYDYEEGFDQEFVQKVLAYYGIDSAELVNKAKFAGFYNQLENVYLGKEFGMKALFDESILDIQEGLEGYKENILIEDRTMYYI